MASILYEYGIIALGNSGVGKSLLLNLVANQEIFKHEASAKSVTATLEQHGIVLSIGGKPVQCELLNVPGLSEGEASNQLRNKEEIRNGICSSKFQVCNAISASTLFKLIYA
jgi:ribosome-interacting GTPase 1